MILPTVKIRADVDGGYLVINERDFDGHKHVLFIEGQDVSLSEPPVDGDAPGHAEYDAMSVRELRALAKERGVVLGKGVNTRAEILAALQQE